MGLASNFEIHYSLLTNHVDVLGDIIHKKSKKANIHKQAVHFRVNSMCLAFSLIAESDQ